MSGLTTNFLYLMQSRNPLSCKVETWHVKCFQFKISCDTGICDTEEMRPRQYASFKLNKIFLPFRVKKNIDIFV